MTSEQTAAIAVWQQDLNRWVAQSGIPWLRWLNPQIRLASNPMATVARTRLKYIQISPEILHYPAQVRHYILLHELGHIVALHHPYMLCCLAYMALASLTIGQVPAHDVSGIVKGLMAGLYMVAALALLVAVTPGLPPLYELEADQYAARMIGRENVIGAMLWLTQERLEKRNRGREKRLRRLGYDARKSPVKAGESA